MRVGLKYFTNLLHLPEDLGLTVILQPGAGLLLAAGDPAVDDVFGLKGLGCVVTYLRLFSSLDIQPLEQFRVANVLRTD